MLESEKLALAAHLHVVLRRRVGRVTDVEWLVRDMAYAREILALALASEYAECHEWAHKLQAALFPPVASAPRPLPTPAPAAGLMAAGRRYIGSLR